MSGHLLRGLGLASLVSFALACGGGSTATAPTPGAPAPAPSNTSENPDPGGPVTQGEARMPLVTVADVELPGRATRFDYQDVDAENGHLVLTHMNDGTVVIADLADGKPVKELKNIPTARGVVVAPEPHLIFVTSMPDQLVLIDSQSLTEVKRVTTGSAPDGVGWDSTHQIVGVSDQGDGAVSLIAGAGSGARKQVPLGDETGNVIFDPSRNQFWVTVVGPSSPDRLVSIDPEAAKVATSIDLPGCDGAHGLRIHPDGQSALVACEGNDKLARVDLGGKHDIVTAKVGAGPDVMAIDVGLGWLYVAAESGDLTVFDLKQSGLSLLGRGKPGDHSHSVAVDQKTHRVFFPLLAGANGKPALHIMQPTGL